MHTTFRRASRLRPARLAMLPLLLLVAGPAAPPAMAAEPDAIRFPEGSVIDVTQEPYHAVPDDGNDDAAAIQQAITDHLGTGRFLYFPDGVYDIATPLVAIGKDGKWKPRLVLFGQSRARTVLRLMDGSPAFASADKPAALLATGSMQQQNDSPDGGGNKAFGNYVCNLTIDAGRGSPGAVGIDWAVSNFGAIKNVTIRAADGSGFAGISLRRKIPGPGLIQNVTIDGFDSGINYRDVQYGLTVERLTLRNQRSAGIRLHQNVMHIRELTSENACPAIVATHPSSMLTLIDSTLAGGAADQPAIACEGTALLRNVTTRGYRVAAHVRGRDITGPHIDLATEPDAAGERDAASLPIAEAPVYHEADLSQWQVVGPRLEGEPDDTAAIQRAIDAGKPVVYFRNDRVYFLSDTVIIRGGVRKIIGFGTEINLGAAREPFSNADNPRPLFRIDPTDHDTVFIEHVFFNAQYPGEVIFESNTPADVVVRHCAGWVGANGHRRSYQNTENATGRLFLEDVFLPGWSFTNQRVWARQFNPENPDGDGVTPQVTNQGGRLWILGFKTEGPAPYIATAGDGVTELLGAYNYVSATAQPRVPRSAVPYIVDHAAASLTFATDNFRDSDYDVYVRKLGDGGVRAWSARDLPGRNGHETDRSVAVPLLQVTAE